MDCERPETESLDEWVRENEERWREEVARTREELFANKLNHRQPE